MKTFYCTICDYVISEKEYNKYLQDELYCPLCGVGVEYFKESDAKNDRSDGEES